MTKILLLILGFCILAGALLWIVEPVQACHGLDPGQTCAVAGQGYAATCDDQCMPSRPCLDSAPSNGYLTDYGSCGRGPDDICGGAGHCRKRNSEARDFQCNGGYHKCGDSCCSNCSAQQGNSCQSGANACGMRNNGTIQCSGACSASTPPNSSCPAPTCSANPGSATVGQVVTATAASGVGPYSWSSGGGNPTTASGNPRTFTYSTTGPKTITVTDTATGKSNTCAVTVCVANFNQACQSAAVNACNMRGNGTIQCDGSCNAVVPPVSACPPPSCVAAPASPQTGQVVTATGSSGIPPYTWNSGGGIPATGGGNSFNTLYPSSGGKVITINDSNGKSGTCNVNVGAAFTANGTVITSPAHPGTLAYSTAYTVRVRVWDADGRVGAWSAPYAYSTKPGPLPVVNFTYAPTKVIAKQQIQFTGTSANGPISNWSWAFGDNTTGSGQTAAHTYAAEGSYSVTLQATNSAGTCVSAPQNLGVIKPIPTYREVRPGQQPATPVPHEQTPVATPKAQPPVSPPPPTDGRD